MRIMIVGDTHGNAAPLQHKVQIAKSHGADRIIVVGDFGMWQGYGGLDFLDRVNAMALINDIHIFALPGNHENYDLWNYHLANPHAPKSAGFTYIRSNILISPKVHNWKWDNKKFFIAGGAVSIDKQWRTPGESWWAEEELSEKELESVLKVDADKFKVDYLFTHDQSYYTNWGFHLVPDPASQIHRRRIDKVIAHLKPRMQFAGHMHRRYDWLNTQSHGFYSIDEPSAFGTKTYGLDCDGENNSWMILDTDKDEAYWPEQAGVLIKE